MAKRFLLLIGASAVISVLLLLVGAAVLDRINAFASSQAEALVLSQSTLADGSLAGSEVAEQKSLGLSAESVVNEAAAASMPASALATAAQSITVAELLGNPGNYYKQTVTLNGRVTLLNDDEFLLNDGTGQILVDLEDDDFSKLSVKDGDTIAVTGIFETDDGYLDVDACEVTTILGVIALNDCSGSGDNSNDSGDDNSNSNDDDSANSNDDDSANSNDDDSNSNDDDDDNSNDDDGDNSNDDDDDDDDDNDNDD